MPNASVASTCDEQTVNLSDGTTYNCAEPRFPRHCRHTAEKWDGSLYVWEVWEVTGPGKPKDAATPSSGEELLRTRILARIDGLTAAANEAFEEADDTRASEETRHRMSAKGHRYKATAHELGRVLAPRSGQFTRPTPEKKP